jgi:hypothetical protein
MSYVREERSRRASAQSDSRVLRSAIMSYDVQLSVGEEHSTCTKLVKRPDE